MDYYYGRMQNDMPAAPGRSQAVSTDVADTVEGLMPFMMDIFAGSDEVVRFEPVGPEDEQAAQQETDYVNHVFMQQNPGFMVLYGLIKDALLQKVGIVKVGWEEETDESRETYLDQPEEAFAQIAQAAMQEENGIEIVEHSVNDEGTHDVTIVKTREKKGAKVYGVPPEEFGIERNARDIKTPTTATMRSRPRLNRIWLPRATTRTRLRRWRATASLEL
jgi:homospermidine synthase